MDVNTAQQLAALSAGDLASRAQRFQHRADEAGGARAARWRGQRRSTTAIRASTSSWRPTGWRSGCTAWRTRSETCKHMPQGRPRRCRRGLGGGSEKGSEKGTRAGAGRDGGTRRWPDRPRPRCDEVAAGEHLAAGAVRRRPGRRLRQCGTTSTTPTRRRRAGSRRRVHAWGRRRSRVTRTRSGSRGGSGRRALTQRVKGPKAAGAGRRCRRCRGSCCGRRTGCT